MSIPGVLQAVAATTGTLLSILRAKSEGGGGGVRGGRANEETASLVQSLLACAIASSNNGASQTLGFSGLGLFTVAQKLLSIIVRMELNVFSNLS